MLLEIKSWFVNRYQFDRLSWYKRVDLIKLDYCLMLRRSQISHLQCHLVLERECSVLIFWIIIIYFRSGSIILKYMVKMKSNKDMDKTEMHQDVISTIQSNSASMSAMSITMEPVENVQTSFGRDLNFRHLEFIWNFCRKFFLLKLITKYLTHILSCHLPIYCIHYSCQS